MFAEYDDVANVLVGPAFVAVGLHRPDRWEQLLDPMLRTIAREFASGAAEPESSPSMSARADATAPAAQPEAKPDGGRALDRAWQRLGSLRADDPADLDRILVAAASSEGAERQVAARLLVGAPADRAEPIWDQLLGDASRGVRRATVDAMVDAERPAVRPLLERALHDTDAWTRWKALRGLVELGIEPGDAALSPLAGDPDFRVRLEAARARGGLEAG